MPLKMLIQSKISALSVFGLALAVLCPTSPAHASACLSILDDSQRLACYDQQFRPAREIQPVASAKVTREDSVAASVTPEKASVPVEMPSKMMADWDLSAEHSRKPFEIRAYKPVYLLLGTHTNSINRQPQSGNSANSLSTPINGLSANESQFQLSFKTKVWENIFGDNGSLWVGYTQSSRWQVYSDVISRPFRETNYEPEAMLMFRTPVSFGGWNLRMSGIGFNHQSNGRANPLSRSWNRIVGHVGLEKDDLSVVIRPWLRVKENAVDDNNPGIQNYIGRGELIVAQRLGGNVISLQGRHSLRSGDASRGSVKFDWAIPVAGNLKAHLSVFSGYGESLIDYNHRQTMFGAGISLVDW
jgi:phospholipase A1